jgi:sugar (pentulose or hexulose) kinase
MGINILPASIETLDAVIRVRAQVEPDEAIVQAYDTLFDIYQDADRALKSISERLHDFERKDAQ